MPNLQYVVGQWVRGDNFYGRSTLIDEVLCGNRDTLWILGTRRIGKTSLLKQIEYVTTSDPALGYFPLFWDLQGSDNAAELHMGFNDALFDAEERLEDLGIPIQDAESDDIFRSLRLLRRHARAKKLKLLLLCDEVEELINLQRQQPALLRKLRHALQSTEDIRSVLASTIRLWALADQDAEDTSPFLHSFTPPFYIHALSNEEAAALIQQVNLPSDSRPRIDDEATEFIRAHCDNHPYLIQLVSKRYAELADLQESIEQIATDPMVSHFFSVDFEMLTDLERQIIRKIAERDASTSNTLREHLIVESDTLTGTLSRLEHLGYIRRNESRDFVLVNFFFRRWLKEQPPPRDVEEQVTASDEALHDLLALGLNRGRGAEDVLPGGLGDRYALLQEVGRGATGVVYKAHDRVLQVNIALKLLLPEISEHPDAIERFRREIVLTLDVNHPNILPIYHLGEIDNRRFLTMKWIDGGTLAAEIKNSGPLSLDRVLAISRKLASALEALHACGVLHRDVKPHNILIDSRDEPYISDFGMVRLLGRGGMTHQGLFLGTPNYASPEQARLEELDERSDIYALGLVIFEMATARRPFTASSVRDVLELHKNAAPPEPTELCPGIPIELSAIIRRCLEKEREHRFPAAGALRAALDGV